MVGSASPCVVSPCVVSPCVVTCDCCSCSCCSCCDCCCCGCCGCAADVSIAVNESIRFTTSAATVDAAPLLPPPPPPSPPPLLPLPLPLSLLMPLFPVLLLTPSRRIVAIRRRGCSRLKSGWDRSGRIWKATERRGGRRGEQRGHGRRAGGLRKRTIWRKRGRGGDLEHCSSTLLLLLTHTTHPYGTKMF